VEFSSEVIALEVDGPVATLWLDRPDARNALGQAFWRDLPRASAVLADLEDLRAVVLAARGAHFTVGLDLKDVVLSGGGASGQSRARVSETTYRAVRQMQAAVTSLEELPVPVVAAAHGYCLGAGIDLLTACDVRLCATDTVFSVRETRMAIVADLGTLQRLPRVVAPGIAAELALTGDDFDSVRAERIGFVSQAVEGGGEGVYAAALALARRIAANSPLAVRGTKAVLAANDGHTVAEGLDYVARWSTMHLDSDDLREAISAFMEKRSPEFRGT
jgi:enoyl-CoA hydratase